LGKYESVYAQENRTSKIANPTIITSMRTTYTNSLLIVKLHGYVMFKS